MKKSIFVLFILLAGLCQTGRTQEAFIGEIRLFAGNYAPTGWAFCNGMTLQVTENQALFSILGNFYGGDGKNTFALPDLRGRVPIGAGKDHSMINNYELGGKNGTEIFQPISMIGGPSLPTTGTGGDKSFDNRQPYLVLNYIICLSGIYPVRQ